MTQRSPAIYPWKNVFEITRFRLKFLGCEKSIAVFQKIERKPCKTLFINTPQIPKMYKGIRKKKSLDFPLQLVAESG
jgi:hypothetical protein